jgi:sulfide dehydrogenase [flavocytochrome c] flavoprotein subunit
MSRLDRRAFIRLAGGSAALSALGVPLRTAAARRGQARVLVVGGGYGGAIAAKYVKLADPSIRVTLIERNPRYVSCPLSNEVLGGERSIGSLTFDYRGLSRRGVNISQGRAVSVDAKQRFVRTADGQRYNYDKLIVSPGIAFRWDAVDGYDEAAAELVPHAWKAGPQTLRLRDQIRAMRDGGVVYIVAPPNPFRCPPGPYERAAQIAHYLKSHKPRSKVVILDAKDAFSKQALFQQGWKLHYGDMIEWVGAAGGGAIEAIRPETRTLVGLVEEFKGDVINLIPSQKAGALAQAAGLTDESGWCPVDEGTFESLIHRDVHVIGDACVAGRMPKSGYAANSQGKVCAAAVVAALNGIEPPEPSYVNTCYSIIAPDHGISVAAVYRLDGGTIVPVEGAGGLSPADAPERVRRREAGFARDWFRNITSDMFT